MGRCDTRIQVRQAKDRKSRLATCLAHPLPAACLIQLLHGIFAYATAGSASGPGAFFSPLHPWRIPAFYDLHANLTVQAGTSAADFTGCRSDRCSRHVDNQYGGQRRPARERQIPALGNVNPPLIGAFESQGREF
jgi:hypothetical protein